MLLRQEFKNRPRLLFEIIQVECVPDHRKAINLPIHLVEELPRSCFRLFHRDIAVEAVYEEDTVEYASGTIGDLGLNLRFFVVTAGTRITHRLHV